MKKYRVIYQVEEIRGECPLYEIGDKIVIDTEPIETLNLKESDKVCMRAVDNMCYRLVRTAASDDLLKHVVAVNGEYRIACPNPGPPYTPCGFVVFRTRREELGG